LLNREQQLKAFASVLRKLVFAPQAKPEENSATNNRERVGFPGNCCDNDIIQSRPIGGIIETGKGKGSTITTGYKTKGFGHLVLFNGI
jgi:hypothetical protein